MLNRVIAWFDARYSPVALAKDTSPPHGVTKFTFYFVKQFRAAFALRMGLVAVGSIADAMMPIFVGTVVGLLATTKPGEMSLRNFRTTVQQAKRLLKENGDTISNTLALWAVLDALKPHYPEWHRELIRDKTAGNLTWNKLLEEMNSKTRQDEGNHRYDFQYSAEFALVCPVPAVARFAKCGKGIQHRSAADPTLPQETPRHRKQEKTTSPF